VKRGFAAVASLLYCLRAGAANPTDDRADWYLQVDNDVVYGTDRWYTSGVRLARVHRDIEWALAQEIYTPDARDLLSGRPDRAPAARLLVSVARHFRGSSAYQTVGMAAGVRGPAALGRQASDAIHHLVPARRFDWGRQLDNEYDAQVVWARSQRSDAASPVGEGLKIHFGTVLGNQVTFAHLGAEYRIGSGTARGLSSPLLRFAPTPPLTDGGAPAHGWSAYAGASVRGVARNELLARDYDPTLAAPSVRRGIVRGAAGVSYSAGWGSMHFGVAHETREFAGQNGTHGFGALTLHMTF
jgi:lipid A 3-O-deacylase